MAPTVLLTGGAGFIGSSVVRLLLAHGCRVVNLDRFTYAGNRASLLDLPGEERHRLVTGDVADRPLLDRLLHEERPQWVVHLAAESHVDRSIAGPAEFLQTNVLGTFQMLDASLAWWRTAPDEQRQAFRYLQVSTDEVYGALGPEGAFRESDPFRPNSPYAASKAAADHFVRAYFHTYGLPCLTTHCSNNYGPRQHPEKLIPRMIVQACRGQPLPVYGDGRQVRDWLHVEDHAAALLRVLEAGRPGETYNIGGRCERTNLEVVEAICEAVDRLCPQAPRRPSRQLIEFVTDRPGHDRRYAIDDTKIAGELNWRPARDFSSGLPATVQWYLDHPEWIAAATGG